MEHIALRLRTLRRRWRLSLREVEKQSLTLARESGNESFQISASWLNRVERGEHELTASKLLALTQIYNTTPEQLLRFLPPQQARPMLLQQPDNSNATTMSTEGSRDQWDNYLLTNTIEFDGSPNGVRAH